MYMCQPTGSIGKFALLTKKFNLVPFDSEPQF